MAQLESHFNVEWKERVTEDGMFDDEEVDTWRITKENGIEFIEAINVYEWIDEDCLNKIIDETGVTDVNGIKSINFDQAVQELMHIVIVEK
tara:strand:- start:227 stop:499 length:273 start_codon:yes stop_codon:yes gene_type:complete